MHVVATQNFQRQMIAKHPRNWGVSLTFEKMVRYPPHFKSVIGLPIYVIGIDM